MTSITAPRHRDNHVTHHVTNHVTKEAKAIHTSTTSQKDAPSPRKPKLSENKHTDDDIDDVGYSDSSLPDIDNGKQKRLTRTRKMSAIRRTGIEPRRTDVEPLKLHLPRIKSNPSLVGSEKRDEEKEKDESEESLVHYADHPILQKIQDNVIGQDLVINTPYGNRNVVYCDFTASGRTLSFIENYIKKHVFPTYANTHSTTGHNARQTGKFREEARTMIKSCVNAGKDDVVIFTGSGTTAGMHKLAWALKITQPNVAKDTVVITGPYEHHSNILPWREYGTKVVRLREEPETGLVDLHHLTEELKFWKEKRRHILVCISAASNVTGIITDVDAVSSLAHKYGALAVFDYAAGGPYLKIDMNPNKNAYKDAVILSPHKFVGGPGTPGVIIAKKWIFKNPVPDKVGGGTVKYVTREMHGYLSNIEEREEGGTPAIIESIRAGLVFKLKQDVGEDLIQAREEDLCRRAFTVWEKNPCIIVLGNHSAERVPIFSFVTSHTETGRLVHHNFISTLLSDLYGIQARGGCACAGPYGEDLLGLTEAMAKKFYTNFLAEKTSPNDKNAPPISMEIMKPGFTRINLAYFNDDEMVDYVISAVDMVTRHGWKLLPQYTFDIKSGSWTHKDFANMAESELKTLDDADIFKDRESRMSRRLDDNAGPSYQDSLAQAEQLFRGAEEAARMTRISSASLTLRDMIPRDKRKLRWFLTPTEAMNIMADKNESYMDVTLYNMPFKIVNPVHRIKVDDDSEYHGGRSASSGRTQHSQSTSIASQSSIDGGYTRHNDKKPPKPRNNGSLTDRGTDRSRKDKSSNLSGSQTDRSDRSERSRSLQNRGDQARSDHNSDRPGLRRERSFSRSKPERLVLKENINHDNMARKVGTQNHKH